MAVFIPLDAGERSFPKEKKRRKKKENKS